MAALLSHSQSNKQQESRDSLTELPTELLGLIFDHVPAEDLLSVTCTCKLFHAITEPRLYHSVVIRSQERLACFRQALTRNPAYAKLVRSFGAVREYHWKLDGQPPSIGLDLLGDLPKLESLLVDAPITYVSVIDIHDAFGITGHLPLLTTCDINIRSFAPYRIDLGYLGTLLTWPTLTSLTLHNINTEGGVFNDDPAAISKLRKLHFFSSCIDPTSLNKLMSAMENLEELVIHSMSDHELYQWEWDYSGYDHALDPVSKTLQVLVLIKEHGQPCERPLQLKNMEALKYVSADLDMWFGYDFVTYTTSRETVLQNMIPPNLKTMRIGGWKGGSDAMRLNRRYNEDEIKAYTLKTMMYSVAKFAPALQHIEFEQDWHIGTDNIVDLPEVFRKFGSCYEDHGISVSMTEWDRLSSRFLPVGPASLPGSEDTCPL